MISSQLRRAALERASAAYSLDRDFVRWPTAVRMAVGTELKNLLLQDITLTRDKNGEVVINGQVLTAGSCARPLALSAPVQPSSRSSGRDTNSA